MIIDKWDYRINDVIDASLEFAHETELNFIDSTFDEVTYRDKLLQDLYLIFNLDISDIIVSIDSQGNLAGFAILAVDEMLNPKPVGILSKFYVRPSYRGTTHARYLAAEVTKWFDAKGITESFATSTGGVGEAKQFENLFRKYGYSVMGTCMRRTHG